MTIHRRAAALVAVLASAVGVTSASAGSAAFTDPVGDANGAPDIRAVSMSDVAGTGTIIVSVTATGLVASTSVDVWLDTDKNSSTGSPTGSEYLLEIWQEPGDWGWTLEKWTGTTWAMAPDNPADRFSRSGDEFTWTLNKSDLGDAAGFAFHVGGYLFDGTTLRSRDFAPDGGSWVYDLTASSTQVVKAVIGTPVVVPAKPRAGQLLSLAFPVARSDNGQALSGATISATTKLGGVSIPHTQSLNAGSAAVNVLIPKKAKGKLLAVTLRITAAGQSTTKVISFKIT